MREDGKLTYAEVGATAGVMPPGYLHIERRALLGEGPETFQRAVSALVSWEMHRRCGFAVHASHPSAVEGATVVLAPGWWKARWRIPCRVVYRVDEDRRGGFAYGTLPGHPERGEEAFIVTHERSGEVALTIRAFSRPAALSAKLAGPVGRAVQRLATARYVRAMQELARESTAG